MTSLELLMKEFIEYSGPEAFLFLYGFVFEYIGFILLSSWLYLIVTFLYFGGFQNNHKTHEYDFKGSKIDIKSVKPK